MSLKKYSWSSKLIKLAFPILLSGCIHNPYTIKMADLNKDGLQDIAITDAVGRDTTGYIQVNEGEYVNSPFYNAHKIKVRERIMKSSLYNHYKIKKMDLNKDSLSDFVMFSYSISRGEIHINNIDKYLQRKDGKYTFSVEKMRNSPSSGNDDLLPIEIWAISPGGLLYPNQ
jgi:hypothetical protein